MLCDHPFSQRNRTTEGTVGMGVGSDREVGGGGWTKFEKNGKGRQYIGGLHKITRLAPLCQLCKETLEFSHFPNYKTNPSIPGSSHLQ